MLPKMVNLLIVSIAIFIDCLQEIREAGGRCRILCNYCT